MTHDLEHALNDLKRYAPTGSYLSCCAHDQADGACVHLITPLQNISEIERLLKYNTTQNESTILKQADAGETE